MNDVSTDSARVDFSDSKFARRRRTRALKDKAAAGGIAVGGISVIIAIVLIFVYLLAEVIPLFEGASMKQQGSYAVPLQQQAGETLLLTLEEQAEIGLRITDAGQAIFFASATGEVVEQIAIDLPADVRVTSLAQADPASALLAYGLSDGSAVVFRHKYKITYPDDKRHIAPYIEYPYGSEPLRVAEDGQPLTQLSLRDDEYSLMLAAVSSEGELAAVRYSKEEDFLSEEVVLEAETLALPVTGETLRQLGISIDQRWLFVASGVNKLNLYDLKGSEPVFHSQVSLTAGARVDTIKFLLGGISLLVGDETGNISQWFLVRDDANDWQIQQIRTFDALPGAITHLEPEHRRKGFVGVAEGGEIAIYNSTAQRTVYQARLTEQQIVQTGIAPRANALLVEDDQGQIQFWNIHNEHPEISWSVLWEKVWYESYPEPQYVWQSSAATNDFEPKMSLMPLTFGTLKAAFYAMLLAAPLAICGAIYTAYFMTPGLRRKVKPLIEFMEALPTVILGFLAGLWLAPFVENYLPGIFSLFLLTPLGILLVSYLWVQLPSRLRHRIPDGWEVMLLLPVILLVAWFSIAMSTPLENALFDGNMRIWLGDSLGISFDQRNAMVVGLAMGFAVIPTIFSITEDAIFSVPKHLSNGSLALGATPWQTLTRVVLLTASPGIFSAVMIGFGRAVGETMIVLMATGNTPIMDWNIFEGMRTLAANIAVEMPEAEVGSTHFRVLFLAALVLFSLTFMVNTAAEIVRQRLRKRYGSL